MRSHSQIASLSFPPQEKEITDEERKLIDHIANAALSGEWKKVLFMYQTHGARAHKAVLNKAGDTALRIAISSNKTDIAKKLVDEAAKTPGVLERTNERGVTVLHVAAYLGKTDLCHHIAGKKPALMGSRNNVKETPLFLAAHFGHLEAFLSLYKLLGDKNLGYIYGRRGDGETILHTAISRGYYDIAYHIIELYPNFVYAINEKGFSPLYLMASTPSAFRSGCPEIRGIHNLVYNLIPVSKLKKPDVNEDKKEHHEKQQTCISSPWHRIMAFMGCSKNQHDQSKDEEGQPEIGEEQGSDTSKNGPGLQCLINAISGLGGHIKETKQKNVWSKQIMIELVNRLDTKKFKYEHNGMSPGRDEAWENWLGDTIPTIKNIPVTPWDDPDVIYPIYDSQVKIEVDKDIEAEAPRQGNNEAKAQNRDNNKGEVQKGGDNDPEAQKPGKNEAGAQKRGGNEAEAQRREREALKSIAKKETPILVAARNGVIEIVKEVLEDKKFKLAINDSNIDNKNVVLLAAENRRTDVYDYLEKTTKDMKERIFGQIDKDGNSALHLAAKLKDDAEPWPVPGAALQMQCEVKWYEFVKDSMPQHFFRWFNDKEETPVDLFQTSHTKIVKEGGEWLNKTSNSFTLVATLIATVAFATSAIVPGGVDDDGNPNLENRPAFSIFAISSLVALCFSIICVMMFLAILTSSYKDVDFGKDLPRKFLIGLTSMFVSITSMLISFCAGHSFVIKEELKYAALPVYAITCLAVTVVTIAQFPFYFDLVRISFTKKPWSNK